MPVIHNLISQIYKKQTGVGINPNLCLTVSSGPLEAAMSVSQLAVYQIPGPGPCPCGDQPPASTPTSAPILPDPDTQHIQSQLSNCQAQGTQYTYRITHNNVKPREHKQYTL